MGKKVWVIIVVILVIVLVWWLIPAKQGAPLNSNNSDSIYTQDLQGLNDVDVSAELQGLDSQIEQL